MQLRRAALPLSLLALLAGAGCVSVGPQSSVPVPARGSVPPADVPEPAADADHGDTRRLAEAPVEAPAALGDLPDPVPPAPTPTPRRVRPPVERPAQPAAPRRVRPPKPAPPRPPRPAPPRVPRGEELCAAAEGTLPPSVVDLCVRQYGG
ncbi:hypothetical protein [Streptomyces sp. NPDC048606]|uniref:hypothetical protein n=1 Tax=Streptomyces sp. NPDC048606 TaxID=3154726 RepID=UPI003433D723